MKKKLTHRQIKQLWGAIFVIPSFLIVFLFAFYPLCRTLYLSFCSYNFGFDQTATFIGLKNYAQLFSDGKFHLALKNTAGYAVISFLLMLLSSLTFALLLFFKKRNTWFFRTALFTPIVVPLSLTCLLFGWMLSGSFGIVNQFLIHVLHMPQLAKGWLTNSDTAMGAIVVVNLWNKIGFPTILFLAGLQNISPDLLEAAEIDGAVALKKIRFVILPNLKETYVIVGMWIIMQALKVFEGPMVLTSGRSKQCNFSIIYVYL